jgi:hypothetical protein
MRAYFELKIDEFVKQKSAIKIRTTILLLISVLSLFFGFGFIVADSTAAAVNESMNFQGKLVNSDGTNISDGSYYFRVTVYDSAVGGNVQAGPIDYKYSSTLSSVSNISITYTDDTDESTLRAGMVIWNTADGDFAIIETVDTATNTLSLDRDVDTSPYGWVSGENITTRIQVSDGIFNLKIVELGGLDFNTDSLYVEVAFDDTTAGGDALNETFSPRKRLNSVPYAMRAKYADYSLDNYWQRTGTVLSPETAGDDLRLGLNEQLQFGDTGQITFEYGSNVLAVTTGADDINFDGNTLFVDGSADRVGIGTSTPENFKLQIAGDIGPDADNLYSLGSPTNRWKDLFLGPSSLHITSTAAETTTARDWIFGIDETDGTTDGSFRIMEGANKYFTIATDGNVGIGTTSPQNNLHVAGGARITDLASCDLVYTDASGDLQCGTNMGATWEAYDNTGGQDISTAVTVNLDSIRQSNTNYSLLSDEVNVGSDGVYEITYSCSIDVSLFGGAGSSTAKCWLQSDTGTGFSDVAGSSCYIYNSDTTNGEGTCTRTVVLDLVNSDDLRIRALRDSGSVSLETISGGSSLTIRKLISSGADLAEIYYTQDESLEAGDVVSIDPDIKYGVTKANEGNKEESLGIIASHSGLIIGETDVESEGRPVLVALAGRVPVKIDPKSEDINYGDYVAVSKESGMVSKAVKPGLVLGKALEDWTKPEQTEDKTLDLNGDLIDEESEETENKTIDILVQNMWYQPEDYTADLSKLMSDYRSGALGGSGGTNPTGWIFEGDSIVTSADVVTGSLSSTTGTFSILNAQSLTIGEDKFIADSQGNLNLAGNLVVAGYISGRYGDVKVRLGDSDGNDRFIIANSNKQEVFSIDSKGGVSIIDGKDASTGFGTISRGSRSSVIKTSQVEADSKVYITFKGDYSPATRYWVSDIKSGDSFRVRLDAEANRDVEFTWWVINSVN